MLIQYLIIMEEWDTIKAVDQVAFKGILSLLTIRLNSI